MTGQSPTPPASPRDLAYLLSNRAPTVPLRTMPVVTTEPPPGSPEGRAAAVPTHPVPLFAVVSVEVDIPGMGWVPRVAQFPLMAGTAEALNKALNELVEFLAGANRCRYPLRVAASIPDTTMTAYATAEPHLERSALRARPRGWSNYPHYDRAG